MLEGTEKAIENHLDQHLIRDGDLVLLFKGSDARRYELVNKSLRGNYKA